MEVPLIAPTLIVLLTAVLEWGEERRLAWAALLAGGVLLTAAMAYPGLSAAQVLDAAGALIAYPVGVARPIGVACFLACAVRRLRTV